MSNYYIIITYIVFCYKCIVTSLKLNKYNFILNKKFPIFLKSLNRLYFYKFSNLEVEINAYVMTNVMVQICMNIKIFLYTIMKLLTKLYKMFDYYW